MGQHEEQAEHVRRSDAIDSVICHGDVIGRIDDLGHPLRIGAGLFQVGENVVATKSGFLRYIPAENKYWIDSNHKRVAAAASAAAAAPPHPTPCVGAPASPLMLLGPLLATPSLFSTCRWWKTW